MLDGTTSRNLKSSESNRENSDLILANYLNSTQNILTTSQNQNIVGEVRQLEDDVLNSALVSNPQIQGSQSNRSNRATTSRVSTQTTFGITTTSSSSGSSSPSSQSSSSTSSSSSSSSSSSRPSTLSSRSTETIRRYDRNGNMVIEDNEVAYHLLLARKSGNRRPYNELVSINNNTDKIDKIIASIDTLRDGVIQDSELINSILKLRNGALNVDVNLLDVVLSTNRNKDQIKSLIQAIDEDNNGKISNIEVLDTMLASKQGLIDLNNPSVRSILANNPKLNVILPLLPTYDPSFSGEISDKEAFDIILGLRKGSITGNLASKALYLGSNENAKDLEKSIDIFDPNADGTISSTEFVNALMNYRKSLTANSSTSPTTSSILSVPDHSAFFAVIEQIPDLRNLFEAIDYIDKNDNGLISDQEVVEMSFAIARGQVQFPETMLTAILSSNNRTRDIRNLFSRVDSDRNGQISNAETFNALMDVRSGATRRNLADVLSMILSANTLAGDISNAVSAIDTNNNGVISREERMVGEIKMRRGEFANLSQSALISVLTKGESSEQLLEDAVLNYFDPDKNGFVDDKDLFNKVLQRIPGFFSRVDSTFFDFAISQFDEDSNVRNAISAFNPDGDQTIDRRSFAIGLLKKERGQVFISNPLYNHIKSLNPDFAIIESAFDILDSNNDFQVSAQEFTSKFNDVINVDGQPSFERLSVISDVIDILYPAANQLKAFREAIDVNNDNQLTNQELINGLLKMKRGEIVNPGADIINAVLSSNTDSQKIIRLISQIDADNDGRISNSELANNLLKVRKNEFSAEDLGVVQAILTSNDKYNDIQGLVNLFDRNNDGEISNLELFDALLKIKSNVYNGFIDASVITLLKSKNSNSAAIEGVVNNFDINNDGKTNLAELVNGFLKINARQMPEPPAEILLALKDANDNSYPESRLAEARTFVAAVDKNTNGVISEVELIDMIMAQRNTTDTISFNEELYSAVISANPNSTNIISLMDKIDPDKNGIITDQELINAFIAQKKGEFQGANLEWINKIYSSNPRLNDLQTIYNSVDANGDGTVNDSEVIESLIKYKDDNLEEAFRTQGTLSAGNMQVLESLLGTNSNYQPLQTQLNALTSAYQGDLHEMMNRLLDIRSGAVTDTSYNLLIGAMTARLNQWQTDRPNVYKQKVTSLIAKINQNSATVDTGVNSAEEQIFNSIRTQRALITTKTQELTAKNTELTRIEADLKDPAKTTMKQKDPKGKDMTVANKIEVDRLTALLQATQAQIASAQAAITQAQSAAQAAANQAFQALGISQVTKLQMQRVIDQTVAAKTASAPLVPAFYNRMDDLIDSYNELSTLLPPNKENLLSLLFYDELKANLNTLPKN
ncbi:MAG: hypothetical protein RLZZ361_1023 [Cyanobacteriota bacterium]